MIGRGSLDLEARLTIVKTAKNTIEDCKGFWNSRLPLTKENFPKIEITLEHMTKALQKIKELPVVSSSPFKKERTEYLDTLLSIPKRYIEEIKRAEKDHRYFKIFHPRGNLNSDLFLVEGMLDIAGINDTCMGIIKAEQVRNRDFTLKELNQDALERAKLWHGYSVKGEKIPDKSPRCVAENTWSLLWVMNPITDINDENILYEKITVGNFKSWSSCYQRRLTGLKYVKEVRRRWKERWTDTHLRKRLSQYRRGWAHGLCYPELMQILASPELHIALAGSIPEENKQDLTYIS